MQERRWYSNEDVDLAIACAQIDDLPLLIDLWHPTCYGCAKLSTVTYGDARVQQFLARHLVVVKYNTTRPNSWFRRLTGQVAHVFHPLIVVSDGRLNEGRRFVGYVAPEAFIAHLRLGIGMLHLYHRRFEAALEQFETVATSKLCDNLVAEGLYWQGVAVYRVSGSDALTRVWNRLVREFPALDWAQRADCLDVRIPDAGFDPRDPSTVTVP
ncbi:MAG TPA: hypothetical protein VLE53_04545 [Gemmatimonadaceae bacterium]|nr:hypothetical protein [Gemmatimonadaceae bacterium]